MNKKILSLITVIAIASVSVPVFASEQMGRDSGSAVVQNPTLNWGGGVEIFRNPPTVDQYYGGVSSNNREGNTLTARVDNPTLNWGGGVEIFRNAPTVDQYYGGASSDNRYGLAPSWGSNKESSAGVRLDNPTLQGVFENVE